MMRIMPTNEGYSRPTPPKAAPPPPPKYAPPAPSHVQTNAHGDTYTPSGAHPAPPSVGGTVSSHNIINIPNVLKVTASQSVDTKSNSPLSVSREGVSVTVANFGTNSLSMPLIGGHGVTADYGYDKKDVGHGLESSQHVTVSVNPSVPLAGGAAAYVMSRYSGSSTALSMAYGQMSTPGGVREFFENK